MTDTKNNPSGIRKYLLGSVTDPVLYYTVLVMMSIMYHYRASLAFAYGALALVVGWLVFRIFDFVNKHHIIGFVICIILYYGSLQAANIAMEKGKDNYPITWGLWFLTPQDSVKYNKWYTLAVFILFLIFMLSVIYYFTRVRYRIFMNFLIFIIPFAIYGKEYEKMPIGYIMCLSVGYVLMMVTFRQLHEDKKTIVVDKLEAWKSVAVFAVLFALCSTLIPKPTVEEDRTVLEMLINADALTDRLNAMLDVFRDTASGDQFRGQTNDTPVFMLDADDPMRLKNASFSTYDFKNDCWTVSDIDTYYKTYNDKPINIYFGTSAANALLYAASLDSGFAAKYGISDLAGTELSVPESEEAHVYWFMRNAETVPLPQGATELTSSTFRNSLVLTRAGVMMTDNQQTFSFDEFDFMYTPNRFFQDPENSRITDVLGKVDNYGDMLDDAYAIVKEHENSENGTEKDTYYRQILSANAGLYGDYEDILLDYGGDEKIYELAQQITAGKNTDYDKAKAIEWYFVENGYVYDLEYQKAQGENVDDFLFKSKTGVCVEYATAMALLSRASGIPSRYCEGYLAQEKEKVQLQQFNQESKEMFIVRNSDAHAFPELYIRGYGWVTFEPTMSNFMNLGEKKEKSTTNMLSRAGLMLLAAAAATLLLLWAMPTLAHKVFTFRNSRRKPDKAVSAAMHRLCRLYGISNSHTADETAELVKAASGADIGTLRELFNSSVYGGEELDDNDRTKAMEDYTAAYDALRDSRKKSRKQKQRNLEVNTNGQL